MIQNIIIVFCLLISVTAYSQYTLADIATEYQSYNDRQNELNKTQWPNMSQNHIRSKIAVYSRWVSALDKLEVSELGENDLINYDMLSFILQDELYRLNHNSHLLPLNSEGGFLINMMYSVRGVQLNSDEKRENYIAKLNNTKTYLSQQIKNLKAGQKSGLSRPKIVVRNCIKVLDDALSYNGGDFFLFKPLSDKKINHQDYSKEIILAFQKLRKYLYEDYMKNAPEQIGISEITDGKAYYEQRVRYYTTLDMTPQEVFDVGKSEVKRIKKEMQDIINGLEFQGDYSDFLEFLRTDPQFYVDTPGELLRHAAWLSKKAEEILPKYFNKLPSLPFTVSPVPDEIAPNYTTGRYSGGSMEQQRAGAFWVNTYNLPARPLYVLPALTLHEAVPGHHLQISLAKEILDSLPPFRSAYLSAYGEGWGLYAEYLGKEAGIYATPYQDFGRLTYEMWRACRLVVDPGMHYFGWSKEEAVAYMTENAALSEHEIETEINRYIGWPAQAVSYKIGELKIRELRTRAEEAIGENFDIREFHDLLLSNGSIPLRTLERIVTDYIDDRI